MELNGDLGWIALLALGGLFFAVLLSWPFWASSATEVRDIVLGPPEREAHEARCVDPPCGAVIDPDTAVAKRPFGNSYYYFCSVSCLKKFEARLHPVDEAELEAASRRRATALSRRLAASVPRRLRRQKGTRPEEKEAA